MLQKLFFKVNLQDVVFIVFSILYLMVISQALPKSISIGKIYQLLECTNYDILRNLINIRGVRNRTKLRNIEKIESKNQKPIKNQKNWFFFFV